MLVTNRAADYISGGRGYPNTGPHDTGHVLYSFASSNDLADRLASRARQCIKCTTRMVRESVIRPRNWGSFDTGVSCKSYGKQSEVLRHWIERHISGSIIHGPMDCLQVLTGMLVVRAQ